MALNGVFPGFKHFLVVLFFISNALLILKFSELGGAFIVHFLLNVTADLTVTLTYLTKNVSLVCLLGQGSGHSLLGEGLVLRLNLQLILHFFVGLESVGLFL